VDTSVIMDDLNIVKEKNKLIPHKYYIQTLKILAESQRKQNNFENTKDILEMAIEFENKFIGKEKKSHTVIELNLELGKIYYYWKKYDECIAILEKSFRI